VDAWLSRIDVVPAAASGVVAIITKIDFVVSHRKNPVLMGLCIGVDSLDITPS